MRLIKDLGEWFDFRLKLGKPIREAMEHPVPRNTASWAYVFGSASLTVMILQFITGICLAFVYVPAADGAWNSLQTLNHQQAFGWFIRALHGWGSNFMVALVLIHMVQVFLFGAFKYPRELTWIVGVFLLLMTLGMAFTGQVLRFDQDAYWGLGIGASVMGRIPLIGPNLVHLMLGGPIIAAETLSRFFAIHVFIIPSMLMAFVGVHLLMVLKLGINEWPMPGRVVKRETYLKEYHELTQRDGVKFVPDAFRKDLVFSGLIIIALVLCAAIAGPIGPKGQPDPTVVQAIPRPDFFFLWSFAALALLPAKLETPLLIVGPLIGIGFLVALPLISGTGEKSWLRRPIAVVTMLLALVSLTALTHLGTYSPWSPMMDAWSSAPVPVKLLQGRSALERQGAVVFQAMQCRNCHSLGREGGQRGPALDAVATRLTEDQLIRQVLQGRGNMPAYGKNLSPPETTALVAFLKTLCPAGQAPARDASLVSAIPTKQGKAQEIRR
ncbi:MAG TPA: cytochrome b N-terminal domain-containing protein [Candidatus Saccharimonadales bacterium]|nr:cytochrome b N-terminal domain-containing protein [Candidatus Saccharimonadales bacterium]